MFRWNQNAVLGILAIIVGLAHMDLFTAILLIAGVVLLFSAKSSK